ncbi:MAG TPA: hypothetical protein VGQ99_17075 [Tepidisphaeraceae bacterium]|nr:hypothetical protein [Tepidisphaeraceae bacterium]
MPIVEPIHTTRRIVPLTIERAVTGPTVLDAPDVDDRGWDVDPTGVSYTRADVHGPVVGLTAETDVRVKLKRVRLEAAAEIFLVSKDETTVTIAAPATGGPVPADGIFTLHGVSGGSGNKFAVVEVRLGSTTGPLMMEFGVRVFQQIRVAVRPHLVTINGTACTTTQADITRQEREVNAIWRPCGVRFNFGTATGHNVVRTGYVTAGEITYNSSGAAVGGVAANYWTEFWDVRGQDRAANTINLYYAHEFTNVAGAAGHTHDLNAMTWDRALDATRHGVIMKDGANGNDLAHEFGHFLSLPHADEAVLGTSSREEMWVLRQLMYSFRPFVAAVGYREELGYGHQQRGALITLRNRAQFNRDAEWVDARTRARNAF